MACNIPNILAISRELAGALLKSVPGTILLIAFSLLSACGGGGRDDTPAATTPTRSFAMGFTPFPYNVDPLTIDAVVDDIYARLADDADLVAHHFDNGIPWNAALVDSYPYVSNIMDDWALRKSKTPTGHRVYVSVTPINLARNGLALWRDSADDMPLVNPFDTHAANGDFDHVDVRTAYLNYCKRVIEYFDPDDFAIGIEVNLLRKNTDSATWLNYKALNDFVYAELKTLYPDLPIFVSVSPVEMVEGYPLGVPAEFSGDAAGYAASQRTALADALASSDYYAISLYPYLTAFYNTPYPADFLDTLFALSSKPLAIAETGMLAESLTAFSLNFTGSGTLQDDYLADLLAHADVRDAEFITWFVLQDYDALCVYIGGCSDTDVLWRDTGLYDGFGNIRPAYTRWTGELAVPLQ